MQVAIVGATGAMGRVVVRDLQETSGFSLLLADLHAPPGGIALDVRDRAGAARALRGCFAVVNCVQYQLNLEVMEAALEAGAHYLDLGGLYHMTRRQLALHERFQEKGLLALLGIGGAPGTTNLLAVAAAQGMERVNEIHVRVAGSEPPAAPGPMRWGYSIQTILEEGARPPAVLKAGREEFLAPMTASEIVPFPHPIGSKATTLTIHSEVATLPAHFPGLQECSFGIAFESALTDKLQLLADVGINSMEPVEVKGQIVIPHEVLLASLRRLPQPPPGPPNPHPYGLLRAIARGWRDGREVEQVADCHVRGVPEWGMGLDSDTGCPPSVAAQLLAAGRIQARGVHAPETAVPLEPYFAELGRRGMTLEVSRPVPC